jgi:hypothetical protein
LTSRRFVRLGDLALERLALREANRITLEGGH